MKGALCPICNSPKHVRPMPVEGLATIYLCDKCHKNPIIREKVMVTLIGEIKQYPEDPKGVTKRLAHFIKENRLIPPVLLPPEP